MKLPSFLSGHLQLAKVASIPHNPGVPDTVRQSSMRLLLPLSTGLVMFLVSSMERDPAVAAEAAYLSGLAVAVLVATAFAAPAVNLAHGLQCLLSAAALWVLPGPPIAPRRCRWCSSWAERSPSSETSGARTAGSSPLV